MLTSQMIKDKAKELGIDCIAIGNIERFENAPKLMSPKTYFPGAKSVIAIAMRIPRGTYRGIEEGTHWHPQSVDEAINDVIAFMEGNLTL